METALIQALKRHAHTHYEDGGWDVVVECFTNDEIAEVLEEAEAETLNDAIAAFSFMVDVWADRQADAKNSAF